MKRLKLTLSLIIAVIMMAMCPQSVLADEVTLSFSNGTLSDDHQSITVTDASTGISVTAYHSCSNGGFSGKTPNRGYLFFDYDTNHDGELLSLSVSNGETCTVTNVTINFDVHSENMDGTGPFDIPLESRELVEGYYDTSTPDGKITSVTVTYDSSDPQLNVTLNDNSSTKTNLTDISNITWTEGGNKSTTITPSSASQLQDGITVTADYYESGVTNGWYIKYLNEDKSLTITAPEGGYLTKITMTGAYYGVGIGTLSAGTQTVDGTTITITFDPSDKVKSVTMTGSNNTAYVHEWIESATVEYYDPSYYMTITKTDATTKNIRALDIKNATVIVPDTYTGDINGMKINDGTNDYEFPLNSTITCDKSQISVNAGSVSDLQNANIVFGDYTDYGNITRTSTSGAMTYYKDFAKAWTAAVDGDVIKFFMNASFTGYTSATNYPSLTLDLNGYTLDGKNTNFGQEGNTDPEYYNLSIMGGLTVKNGTLKANIDNANVGGSHQFVLNGVTLEGSSFQWMENGKIVLQNSKINLCNTSDYVGSFWFEDASVDASSSISLTGISSIGGYGNVLGGLKEVTHRMVLPSGFVLKQQYSDKNLSFYNTADGDYSDMRGMTATANGATELSACTPSTEYTNVEGTLYHLCTLCFAPCSEGSIAYDSDSETATTESFTLNDGDDYKAIRKSLADAGLSSDATITVTNLSYNRNYTGNWQALYVPFALDVDALKADYDIAYIIGVRQEDTDNDGTIDYQCMDVGYMPSASKTRANYPYLIRKKTAEDDATITLTDVTIEPAVSKSVVCSTILNNYTVTGAYTETTADAMNGKYGMDNDGSLCLCDGTSALKPQRWAMAVESRGDTPYTIVGGAGAKSIMIHVIGEDDDTATGISSVEYDQSSTSNCYNIAGQRVKSNAKGLVIKNGKKYLNK